MSKAKICSKIKEVAKANVFKSAESIVKGVLSEYHQEILLPKQVNLERVANRYRQKFRPRDPLDLQSPLDYDYMPSDFLIFFQKDILVSEKRHLLFATAHQLELLKKSRRWYLDGIFKVVKAPFTQLMSIHAFIKQGDTQKQLPLAFVLMSCKTKIDYEAVLSAIKDLLEENELEEVMIDFEAAMWGAVREIFPEVGVKGCTFHWVQTVWKKVQELGLVNGYMHDEGTHIFLRKLMALPFLPHEFIHNVFLNLASEANTDDLREICEYVNRTWIGSSIWPERSWSCFMQPVRTNNDLEGWHGRLNRHAGQGQIQFYLLVDL